MQTLFSAPLIDCSIGVDLIELELLFTFPSPRQLTHAEHNMAELLSRVFGGFSSRLWLSGYSQRRQQALVKIQRCGRGELLRRAINLGAQSCALTKILSLASNNSSAGCEVAKSHYYSHMTVEERRGVSSHYQRAAWLPTSEIRERVDTQSRFVVTQNIKTVRSLAQKALVEAPAAVRRGSIARSSNPKVNNDNNNNNKNSSSPSSIAATPSPQRPLTAKQSTGGFK
eukprot:PhM_4_TR14965/c0_g1_i1/m.58120